MRSQPHVFNCRIQHSCTGANGSFPLGYQLGLQTPTLQGVQTPTALCHTAQAGEPDCRGPLQGLNQRDTPNIPVPEGAQCPDQKSMGVELAFSALFKQPPARSQLASPESCAATGLTLGCIEGRVPVLLAINHPLWLSFRLLLADMAWQQA